MTIELWLSFLAASTALLWLPGPTIALVVSYALNFGRASAWITAPGVALGYLASVSLSLAGAAAVLVLSSELFVGVRIFGAAYLIWLGYQFWRANGQLKNPDTTIVGNRKGLFARAFASTALSPKGIGAGAALIPQFITVAEPVFAQFIILGSSFIILAAVNIIVWVIFADKIGKRFLTQKRMQTLNKTSGGFMIGAGIALGASQKV